MRPDMMQAATAPGSARPAVEAAIAAMGSLADRKVSSGTLAQFGAWLGWPDWMRDGTTHAGGHGPLPPELLVRDDLIIVANLVDHVDAIDLVGAILRSGQLAGSSLAKLATFSGRTLRDGFDLLQGTLRLGSPYLSSSLAITGDVAIADLSARWPLGTVEDFAGLCWMAFCYQMIAACQPMALADVELSVLLPAGPDVERLRALFRCPVVPGSAVNALRFPAPWLDRPNPSHDPMIWALARERIDLGLRTWAEADEVSAIRALIVAAMDRDGRPPRMKEVATAAGTSVRTMVRTLQRCGSSFHGIVEEERRIRVLRLIGNPALSLAEIADATGFPDLSSFGRKFRRWFGDSPARYRRAASGKDQGTR